MRSEDNNGRISGSRKRCWRPPLKKGCPVVMAIRSFLSISQQRLESLRHFFS